MNLTISQLLNAKPALEKLFRQELPVTIAFRLARLCRKFNEELTAFDTVRQKVISKHNPDDLEDLPTHIKNAILMELNQIAQEEIEVSFETFDISVFEDAKITASDAMALDFLIKDD